MWVLVSAGWWLSTSHVRRGWPPINKPCITYMNTQKYARRTFNTSISAPAAITANNRSSPPSPAAPPPPASNGRLKSPSIVSAPFSSSSSKKLPGSVGPADAAAALPFLPPGLAVLGARGSAVRVV